MGTILVLPTFLGIFIQPSFGSEGAEIAYYVILPAVFNVGTLWYDLILFIL